ncbi:hypothetical protein BB561_002599 [Smittium simulii]|uniref:Protein arginine methyltransferase NDUFAF7 n=1 Tax=Smittium simulii TaxID=133385 RepID=A0A2T9YPU9_9FUNG|nr:hypothetical protein BB561_002599 [Smittium simulii]
MLAIKYRKSFPKALCELSWPRSCYTANFGSAPLCKNLKMCFTKSSTATTFTRLYTSLSQSSMRPAKHSISNVNSQIKNKILSTGPISISEFMKYALTSPIGGYYTKDNVFGKQGDFITSPEISQMFGEVIGIWYIMQWQARGCPENVELIELGPGKGSLLGDILRISQRFHKFQESIKRVHFIEKSAVLRKTQAKTLLCDLSTDSSCILDKNNMDAPVSAKSGYGNIQVCWENNIDAVSINSNSMTMIMAHEFFDAIPIYRFELGDYGWSEVLIDVADESSHKTPLNNQSNSNPLGSYPLKDSLLNKPTYTSYTLADGKLKVKDSLNNFENHYNSSKQNNLEFKFVKTKRPTANSDAFLTNLEFDRKFETGSSIEISPESGYIAQKISEIVEKTNGAALIVDYGQNYPQATTFRGISKHKFVNPLINPGTIDLTADVDFAYLAKSVSKIANCFGPIEQGDFLHAMGIQDRLKQLLNKTKERNMQENLISSYKRLVDHEAMGKIYKFFAITPKSQINPPIPF